MTPRAFVLGALLVPAPALADFTLVPSGTYATTPKGTVVHVVDYDDDGDLDVLVAASGAAHVDLLENDGTGVFANSMLINMRATALQAADFDGDGDRDLAVTIWGPENQFLVYEKRNNGSLANADAYPLDAAPMDMVARDFDGDGDLDLAINLPQDFVPPNTSSNIQLFRGAGNGTFSAWDTLSTGFIPMPLRSGDLDGDGRPDLVVVDSSYYQPPSYFYGYFNTASGFELLEGPRILPRVEDLVLLDLENDGDLDAATAFVSGEVGTYRNDGAGGFGDPLQFPLGGSLHCLATADLDLDGDDDLVVTSDPDGIVTTFRNVGGGYLVHTTATQVESGIRAVGTGDFDQDGRHDVVVLNTNGSATFLKNQLDVVGVPSAVLAGIRLERARPNPAVEPGPVRFALAEAGPVRLEVVDVRGRVVRRLEDSDLPGGPHQRTWDGADERGRRVPPGLYFYRLESGGRVRVERQVVVAGGNP